MVELNSNSHTLIKNTFLGTSVDRVGLTDSPWSDTLLLWVQEGYPTRWVHKKVGQQHWRSDDGQWEEVAEEGDYEEPVPPWQHFQYDMVGIGPWMDYLPLRDYDETIQETSAWKITRNGAGASFKFWKHKMGTPEHIDFRMVSREIWESDYKPHLLYLDPLRIDLEELRTSREEAEASQVWTHYGNIFIWEIMRQSMGDITLYESLLLDPGWIHDFGKVIQGEKVSFGFKFKNTGNADLVIAQVNSSCGCTVPKFPKTPVKPGDESVITVMFDSQDRKGVQNKTITVASNCQPSNSVIRIKAMVIVP